MRIHAIPPARIIPLTKHSQQPFPEGEKALWLGVTEVMELELGRGEGAGCFAGGVELVDFGGGEGVAPGEVVEFGWVDFGRDGGLGRGGAYGGEAW